MRLFFAIKKEFDVQRTTTYQEKSRIFLAQAHEELAKGDLKHASAKGWDAAAQILKAIAEERGWPHATHTELHRTMNALFLETRDSELLLQFTGASQLFINSIEDWYPAILVENGLQQVNRFMEIGGALLNGNPSTQMGPSDAENNLV